MHFCLNNDKATTMKNLYITITAILLAVSASAQDEKTLADLVASGKSGEYYMISDRLQCVYIPTHHTNVIFVKDDNNYSGKSKPTEEQYNNHKLYDEKDGVMGADNKWTGTFDQSNWMKLVFPEGTDFSDKVGRYIDGLWFPCMANVQNAPCNPLGLTLTVSEDDAEWVEFSDGQAYTPNTYSPANFVLQREWYLVKPQNQEVANIHWAVYNQADKKFYIPKKNVEKGWNMANLTGSFEIDMSLYEPSAGIDPDEVFTDGTSYDFKALIEYRTGSQFTLNIDPGFGGDNNYHFAPSHPATGGLAAHDGGESSVTSRPRRASTPNVAIGESGEAPYLLDEDDNRYDYTVIVYPLRLDHPEIVTGVEQNVGERAVQSVRYCNLQGHVSATPFDGMNIVVTTYSDGTTTATKVIQ